MKIILSIIGIIALFGFWYGAWKLQRTVNYSFQYEELVLETIKNSVKPECRINREE